LNTLGDPETRSAWRDALHEHFRGHASALSEDSQARLERNPLRILDSKAHADWPIVDSAPAIDDYLTAEASDFFAKVTEGLDAAGVKWERAPRLVRGLDYYRHTAFEFVTDRLGAQGTVLGGGRYDGLIETLGGPHTPAVGWAAGIERLAMLIETPPAERVEVIIVDDDRLSGERPIEYSAKLASQIRRTGVPCSVIASGKRGKRFERAARQSPKVILLLQHEEYMNLKGRVLIRAQGSYSELESFPVTNFDTKLLNKLPAWIEQASA